MMEENKEDRYLSREECLKLDIPLYNAALEAEWKKDKVKKNLSGELSTCKHCTRKYSICCICDEAEKRWQNTIEEVRAVCNRDRSLDNYDHAMKENTNRDYTSMTEAAALVGLLPLKDRMGNIIPGQYSMDGYHAPVDLSASAEDPHSIMKNAIQQLSERVDDLHNDSIERDLQN